MFPSSNCSTFSYYLILKNSNIAETSEAQKLFDSFKDVKTKGFFTKEQFYPVAMWKTPRPKNRYLNNSENFIKEISRGVLSTLTMIDPKNYGIIDIRVWQLLYLYGEVKTKPSGQGFSLNDWKIYLNG